MSGNNNSTLEAVLTLLHDRTIVLRRSYVEICGGSINAALMLSQILFWSGTKAEGWFYKTREEWQSEIGLTRTEQETARKILRQKGLIEEKREMLPAKLYFRAVIPAIIEALAKLAKAPPAAESRQETAGILPSDSRNLTVSRQDSCREIRKQRCTTEKYTEINTSVVADAPTLELSGEPDKGLPSKYEQFVSAWNAYWKFKNPQLPFGFTPAEGKALKQFIADNPKLTLEHFQTILRNRGRSEVTHSQKLYKWLPQALDYHAGPLDRFGKPKWAGQNEVKVDPIEKMDRELAEHRAKWGNH